MVDADPEQCRTNCALLESHHYMTESVRCLSKMEKRLEAKGVIAVVLDIDTIRIDNRYIRNLTRNHSAVYFLCLSKDRFHPDLHEALCYHIYACINKPVDPDELLYWIQSIFAEEQRPDT